MKKKLFIIPSLALASVMIAGCGNGSSEKPTESSKPDVCSPLQEDNKVHLIILAGQSGARGKALNIHLTEEEKQENFDVDIIADGLTMPALANIPESPKSTLMFDSVKPGYGDVAAENGPELGMAKAMASRYPKEADDMRSAIVKYTACGSTFVADWFTESMLDDDDIAGKLDIKQIRTNAKLGKDTGPLTNNLYQLIDMAKEQVKEEGLEPVIDGIVWSHGEQDTKFDANMSIYEKALTTFMQDVRAYVGNDKLPFVIGGAMTNAGKYVNNLRKIQERVASKDPYASFIPTQDLGPNRFEPWHLSAEGNMIFGQRAAEEILKLNDTRVITSFEPSVVNVPLGVKAELPAYQMANFDNDYSALVKVDKYADVDVSTVGVKEVEYEVTRNCATYKGKITVNVSSDYAFVDGVISPNEYKEESTTSFGENNKLYVKKAEQGLYVAADIKDSDVYTDGEQWSSGDMGQRGTNDDFRIFLTDGTAAQAKTIAISSDNLLRVYTDGLNINTATDPELVSGNKYYKRTCNTIQTRVVTHGIVNSGASEGFVVESYIPFEALGYTSETSLKVCFEYSDIENGTPRIDKKIYIGGTSDATYKEKDDAMYLDLANYL